MTSRGLQYTAGTVLWLGDSALDPPSFHLLGCGKSSNPFLSVLCVRGSLQNIKHYCGFRGLANRLRCWWNSREIFPFFSVSSIKCCGGSCQEHRKLWLFWLMSHNFVSVTCKRTKHFYMTFKWHERYLHLGFHPHRLLQSCKESHCCFGVTCNREKLEQKDLLGKLDLWDLKGLLERLVLRACGESLVLW